MHQAPASWLRHAVAALGPDSRVTQAALRAAGLSREALEDGTERVEARRLVDFLEHAARLAQDDLLGLRLGARYDLRASGLAAYVAIASPTLRAALCNAGRYASLNDTAGLYGLEETGNAAGFRLDTGDAYMRSHRQATEFKAAFVLAACRRWLDAGFRPLEVRFAHPRAVSRQQVERAFGCPVQFGAEATEMLLSPEQLELPVRGADPYLLALLSRHGDALMASRARPAGLRARTERLVLERLPKGAPTAAEVAAALGLGERTFARRLAEEGASFRQLVADLRRDAAKSYLADAGLGLAQIAYLLGYADQSAFTSAFRRWTGRSPRRFRDGL